LSLARIYQAAGSIDGARRELEHALSIDPKNSAVKKALSRLKKK
jgi:Tfp pilus assembly protein PilF